MEYCLGKMIDNKFWYGKKVLITGYSGFKGFWLSLFLKELGCKVYGISKNNISSEIYQIFSESEKSENNYELDIVEFNDLEEVLNKINPEIIFHLAAQALVIKSKNFPLETIMTNIVGSYNLMNWIANSKNNITTVIATTDKVYNFPEKNNTENDSLGSFEFYGASKVSLENFIAAFNADQNLKNKFSVVRSGNVLGGGDGGQNRILNDVLKSINSNQDIFLRNPDSIRPWQFILDSLYGYILTAQKHALENKQNVYNLNSSETNEFTVKDLTEKLILKFDSSINIKILESIEYVESSALRINSKKAYEELGWKAHYSFDEIIEEIFKWEQSKKFNTVQIETTNQINKFISKIS